MPQRSFLSLRPVRLCRAAYDQIRWRRTTLTPLLEVAGTSDNTEPREVTMVPGLTLSGERRSGVTLPPGTDVVCRVFAPAGATIVTVCGVEGSPGDTVHFEVTTPLGKEEALVSVESGWVTLQAPVASPGLGSAARITLRTTVVSGAAVNIRPVWGAVSLRWPRTAGEIAHTIVRGFRQHGVGGAWHRIRAHGAAMSRDCRDAYRSWLAAHTPGRADLDRMTAESLTRTLRFGVLVIGDDPSRLRRTMESLARQAYPHWDAWIWAGGARRSTELDAIVRSDSRFLWLGPDVVREADARATVARDAPASFIVAIDAGDELPPEALFELAAAAAQHPDAGILYSDEDYLLDDGPGDPQFKPDWSPELLLARMYLGKLLAVRREILLSLGAPHGDLDGAHDYDVAVRAAFAGTRVLHVPKVLCHRGADRLPASRVLESERRVLEAVCQATGQAGRVLPGAIPGLWRIRHRLNQSPRVTIVIPTDAQSGPTLAGRQLLVAQCLRSIIERTAYKNYELLVADNGRLPDEAARLLTGVAHTRISYQWTGPFNFSRKINYAVAHAHGEFLLLLNDDVEVINPDWLTAMLEYAAQDAIGAVGAKLFYPDGRLQHVGVATGVCGIAAHLLHQHDGGSTGCGHAAVVVRNCSAVTGACLLTRRAVYHQVGGFDERMAVDFNDVDFCLRVRAAGYRIVFTPYARLYHHESGSFGSRVQHPRDSEAMRQIWGAALEQDPYYNPNFSRDFPDCRIAPR